MDYNTGRNHLVLPEYGRNIQKMVNHVKTVEDKEERNRLAKAIIQIMGNMNPHLRDVADFTHKLWDHLAVISNFELNVESPYPEPDKAVLYQKPEHIGYKKSDDIRFKHYGKSLQEMIKKAVAYEDGEEKDFLIETLATQMKKSYVIWNRENAVDDQIFADLVSLSRNELKIPEGLRLKDVRDLVSKKTPTSSKKAFSKGKYQSKGRKR
ncbi:MAG: DUF4290 domain-containing protein [Salinivirgaceae bacterium]|jgi:hypothetical protein|nr:DUF4290 domain-containing protein [Salinivirgaceae bacterium]